MTNGMKNTKNREKEERNNKKLCNDRNCVNKLKS